MRKVWGKVLGLFSRFKSPKSEVDVKLNKCDYSIVALMLFIGAYGVFMYSHPQAASKEHSVIVTNQPPDKFVVPKNPQDFVEGQFVGVRYFGIFGVIEGKKLQLSGYVYEVIYKDKSGVLQKIEVEKWLLFVPDRNSLISNVLRN